MATAVGSHPLSGSRRNILSFTGALEAYRQGRFDTSCRVLEDDPSPRARTLLARAHSRMNRNREALAIAEELLARNSLSLDEKIEVQTYYAFVLTRTGDVSGAFSSIERARALLRPQTPLSLEGELLFVEAAARFAVGEHVASERSAWNAIYVDLDLNKRSSPPDSEVPAPLTTTKARALQVIGVIRSTQERYHEHYRILREAISMLRTGASTDLFLQSYLEANRSYYARDLGMLHETVEFEMLPFREWPPELSELSAEIERSLGYLYALQGDDRAAMTSFRSALARSRSAANRLLFLSDVAFVSRHGRQPRVLDRELIEACSCADDVPWESEAVERYALHAFAQELSFIAPLRAESYMRRFEALSLDAQPLSISGDRAQAEADYSAAIIARNNGHLDVAIWRFASSYEIWRRIGYRWRAAAAAIDLGELTGDRAISAYARQEATVFPQSWLVRQIARSEEQAS